MLFTELMLNFINSKDTLWNCLFNPQINWKKMLSGIMKWECASKEYEHLWYVFSYIKILICFPVIKYLCECGEEKTKVRRGLIAILVIVRISNEIQHFIFGGAKLVIYAPFTDIMIAYILLGYEFRHNEKLKSKNRMVLFIIYVVSNLIIWGLNALDMKINEVENYYHSAGSFFILISSCALFALIKSYDLNKLSDKINNIILFIGSKTFGIYLVHYMIVKKIKSSGIVKRLQYNVLLEYILTIIIVLFLSFFIICTIDFMKRIFKNQVRFHNN